MSPAMTADGLPFRLYDERAAAHIGKDGGVVVAAGPRTDLFVDPGSEVSVTSAPAVVAVVPDAGFQFSARVRASLASTFDAGVLLLRTSPDHWAKLCLEQAISGAPTAVSVVTRGVSDDANGWRLASGEAWLRISRDGAAFSFHVSEDGERWELVRLFSLPAPGAIEVGLLAQSPTGEGCIVHFSEIRYVARPLGDPRSGE